MKKMKKIKKMSQFPMRSSLFALALSAVYVPQVLASFDMDAPSQRTMRKYDYQLGNNLPILVPSNDNMTNVRLLQLDLGALQTKFKPIKADEYVFTDGRVPFYTRDFVRVLSAAHPKASYKVSDSQSNFADGEGSRCVSHEEGAAAFAAALRADSDVPENERALLIERRGALAPTCAAQENTVIDEAGISSAHGLAFLQYLKAATAFYDGRFDVAQTGFESLNDAPPTWVKNAANYMQLRTLINAAQQHALIDGVLEFDKVDASALAQAQAQIEKEYKAGSAKPYVASARGLLRKIYWLTGQIEQLDAQYAWQLAHAQSAQSNLSEMDFAQEVENKILSPKYLNRIKTPLLLATLDLQMMRTDNPQPNEPPATDPPKVLSLEALQAQKPLFANEPELHQYLLAVHAFYVAHDNALALSLLPQGAPNKALTYLELSQYSLKGTVLEAMKNTEQARGVWLSLMPHADEMMQKPLVELALALNYEHSGQVDKVFAAQSPIQATPLREVLIEKIASPQLLRTIIAAPQNKVEAHKALYTLLLKDLSHGQYSDYLNDAALLPSNAASLKSPERGFGKEPNLAMFTWDGASADANLQCPSINVVAQMLSQDPNSAKGLSCYAEFRRVNGLDESERFSFESFTKIDHALGGDIPELGRSSSQFTGAKLTRGGVYQQLINAANTPNNLKAYSLYRAVNCYATSGDNHCGGANASPNTRKMWFSTLKKQYASTPWAAAQKIYW